MHDRTAQAVVRATGADSRVDSAAAALSALHEVLDRPTLDRLGQVLGLTSSGAVRLVDRLAAAGLVARGRGTDGRSTAVALTPRGRRAARRVAVARAAVLEEVLAVLTPAQRRTFDDLAGRLLVGMMREPGAVRWTCRLCDLTACGRRDGRCPVGNAARARYGDAAG